MRARVLKNSWQMALALLVGIFLIAMAVSMVMAGRRVSRVVDTQYYDHGLHYGETLLKADAKGWTMTPSLTQNQLQVQVRDHKGLPVSGGRLCYEPRQVSSKTVSFPLAETAPGVYRTQRPDVKPGEEHGTLRFSKADASLSTQVVLFP